MTPVQSQKLTGRNLRDDYAIFEDLRCALPGLVLRHNLHGIDIDARAVQIAALALWMRAQRVYNDLGIVRGDRSSISKTNIVVAEPMPGEKELRKEFIASLDKQLGQLVECVFEKMELAGEAGTLLKIEDEIQEAIRDVYGETGDLFRESDEERWREAEKNLLGALQTYAEQTQNGRAYRRWLFAEDAAHGFAFIDLSRQRYDVVLMNPPFGDGCTTAKEYIDTCYANSHQDLAAAFVERGLLRLQEKGRLGALSTDAGFFRRTLELWRRSVLLGQSTVSVVAHLGDNVLDGAKVRVAAYAAQVPRTDGAAAYIRAVSTDDRETREPRLRDGVRGLKEGIATPTVFITAQSEFEKLPYAVFGYWCSTGLRNAFVLLPTLENTFAHVRQGLATADDFRFLRLRWEIPPDAIGASGWLPFAKGGEYSPFNDDIHLLLNWRDNGREIIAWGRGRPQNTEIFGRPGITYPRRTSKRFAPRILPSGCAFGDKGPAIVDIAGSPWAILGLLNSRPVSYLLSLGTGMSEAMDASNSYEVGLLQRLPVPRSVANDLDLATQAREAWLARADADLRDETTSLFQSPVAPFGLDSTIEASVTNHVAHVRRLTERYVAAQQAIDRRVTELYGLSVSDWQDIAEQVGEVHIPDIPAEVDPSLKTDLAIRLLQFLVGAAMGRWNCAALLRSSQHLVSLDPFAALADHCDHNPVAPTTLVDDLGHDADIIFTLQHVLEMGELTNAAGLIAEATRSVAGIGNDLRAWLRSSFFESHLKHYSKSRRKAPIYWQLSTPSASYSVWLYYHRFTKDTFYKVLNDYVVPKLQHEERKLTGLVQGADGSPTASQRKEIAAQEVFVEELRAFREEIARIAPLWNPNLNDGVIINFAPLWRLVPQHRAWQKECKACWDNLVAGDYDWAHLAMHLWPERVVPKCAEDRSLAIAHGLEEVFWVEGDDGKWQPRRVAPETIDQLIKERTSAAVKDALKSLLEAPAQMTKRSTTRAKGTRRKSSPRTSRSAATNGPDPSMLAQDKVADGSVAKPGEPRGDRDDSAGEAHA